MLTSFTGNLGIVELMKKEAAGLFCSDSDGKSKVNIMKGARGLDEALTGDLDTFNPAREPLMAAVAVSVAAAAFQTPQPAFIDRLAS